MSLPDGVVLRDKMESDRAFVVHSFVKGYMKYGYLRNTTYKRCPEAALTQQHAISEWLFDHCSVTVACSERMPSAILGFMVWSPGAVHWVYVKQDKRTFGLASELVSILGPEFYCTHLSAKMAERIDSLKGIKVRYNRELLFTLAMGASAN